MKLFVKNKPTPARRPSAVAMPRIKKKPGADDISGPQMLRLDKSLVFITLSFIVFGLVFTYSSSAFDSASFFKRQVIFDLLGLIAAAFLSQFYLKIQKRIDPIFIVGAACLLLTIVLFCRPVANVHRWINLGFFNLQPSEVAKPAILIYVAAYLANISVNIRKSFFSILPPVLVTGFTLLLMALAPEIGAPILMFSVVFLMLFVAGARIKHLLILMSCAVPVVIGAIITSPYRVARLFSFLDPQGTASGTGYQLMQSFLAIGSGGWLGKGLGNSELKLQYLPAAHTDFIFSIICEELGLLGVLFIVGLFVWLLVIGIRMALRAKDPFNSMLMLGITLTITMQAFFNMGVATGLLPTKGLPLPFFSYGGSSVLVTICMMGILANLSAVENSRRIGKE